MLEGKWRGVPTAFIALACGAAICAYVIVDKTMKKSSQESKQAHLSSLRISDPQAYLKEIKASDPAKWEAEFKLLDKEGYEKFEKEQRAKRSAEYRNKIEQHLMRLKTLPTPSLEEQRSIYSDLMVFDMKNADYAKKYKSISQQLEHDRVEQERPMELVTLKKIAWNSYNFRGLLRIDVVIKNDLSWPIKDLTLTCTMIAPSGTLLGQATRTIYEKIETKSEKSISNFDMGFVDPQGKLNGCTIADLVILR